MVLVPYFLRRIPGPVVGTGYRNDSNYSVACHLRDAHSAALMIGNERIHAAIDARHLGYRDEAL